MSYIYLSELLLDTNHYTHCFVYDSSDRFSDKGIIEPLEILLEPSIHFQCIDGDIFVNNGNISVESVE